MAPTLTWPQPAVQNAGQLLDATLLLLLSLHLVNVVRHLAHDHMGLNHLLHIAVLAQALFGWKRIWLRTVTWITHSSHLRPAADGT